LREYELGYVVEQMRLRVRDEQTLIEILSKLRFFSKFKREEQAMMIRNCSL